MNAGKEMSREKAIREIAETVFADNKKKGLPPDAMRDWTQAEKIYDNKVYYCLLWHPSKLLEKYYHKVVAAGIILIILLIGLIVNVDRNIGEMRVRPYLEVDPVYPVMIDNADGGNTYFGNYILLKNMGRSPAVNVKVAYYMTTEVDSNKSVGPGWFDQKTEGVSFLGFVVLFKNLDHVDNDGLESDFGASRAGQQAGARQSNDSAAEFVHDFKKLG